VSAHRYSYRIFWSEPDDCYFAVSPEFPRLSAFGDTPAEALKEFQIVLDAAVDLFQEEGWTLPEPLVWRPDATQQSATDLALTAMHQALDRKKTVKIPSKEDAQDEQPV
jgi:predicted RNase H-like HicB family nuclease